MRRGKEDDNDEVSLRFDASKAINEARRRGRTHISQRHARLDDHNGLIEDLSVRDLDLVRKLLLLRHRNGLRPSLVIREVLVRLLGSLGLFGSSSVASTGRGLLGLGRGGGGGVVVARRRG